MANNEEKMSPEAKEDIEFVRKNYYNLLEKGKEGLDLIIEVSRDTEHPRAFSTLTEMLKTMSDINVRLVDLHRQEKIISTPGKTDNRSLPAPDTVNNTLFIGSTAELQDVLDRKFEDMKNIDVYEGEEKDND